MGNGGKSNSIRFLRILLKPPAKFVKTRPFQLLRLYAGNFESRMRSLLGIWTHKLCFHPGEGFPKKAYTDFPFPPRSNNSRNVIRKGRRRRRGRRGRRGRRREYFRRRKQRKTLSVSPPLSSTYYVAQYKGGRGEKNTWPEGRTKSFSPLSFRGGCFEVGEKFLWRGKCPLPHFLGLK